MFVNTLLPVLRDLLIQILLKVLLRLISKATEVLKGAVCDRARGNLSAAVEGSIVGRAAAISGPPVGNLGDLFREAFCGADAPRARSMMGWLECSLPQLEIQPLPTQL